MRRPKTLPAFTESERAKLHELLGKRVATMMGRKLEEEDWTSVYCKAREIPKRGWSNLEIDVMSDRLGVEHKMLKCKSGRELIDMCGQHPMHPSLTRSVRMPSTTTAPDEAMRDIFRQYAELVEARRAKVREYAMTPGEVDMRTGWLLWQESLRQFLYFEVEMLVPEPEDYYAQWVVHPPKGTRKGSTNLWIFERESPNVKRYSVTNEAGVKIQPYFDVPPPDDPNLYLFTVIGEAIADGLVRVWITDATARELARWLNGLDTPIVSEAILQASAEIAVREPTDKIEEEEGRSLLITQEAYNALQTALPGVNDEHSFQLLVQYLRAKP